MQEPSVEFDMEDLYRRVDGAMDPQDDRERELVARGVRQFAQIVLPRKAVGLRGRHGKAMCLRLVVAVYLCRIPGHERFLSLADIARHFGVNKDRVHELSVELREKLGLPARITRSHKRRRR